MRAIPNRLLILICFFSIQNLFAQIDSLPPNNYATKGLAQTYGIEQADLIDQLMVVMPGVGSSSQEILNEQSIKPYLMPPRTKDQFGSANCYALAACLEFYANFQNNYKINLSPDYIYLNLTQDNLVDGLLFLIQQGTVSAAIVPYQTTMIPSAVRNTSRFPIENYLHVYRRETPRQQKIFETRKALMRGNPILVEMRVPADFPKLTKTKVWDGRNARPEVTYPFLVTSYLENNETFELMSVWGPEWANNGYLWVTYDDFARLVDNGFVLVPAATYETEGR
ncbi:MAG: hypothetical protein H6563_09950 [Lewinellaceae bacterium]|nr:hypothetical protein [Lewinellaceae bacterium]